LTFSSSSKALVAAIAFALSGAVDRPPAAAPAVAHPMCRPIFYPRVGSAVDSNVAPRGPGLILMGGSTDVDAAFRWLRQTIAGRSGADGGDIVVLRASGDNDYDKYIYGLARFNSVRTILLPPCASAQDVSKAAAAVDRAQGVFFAGGDQANYVRWKGTPLAAAVQRLYDRGGVVGGTSAGLAIQGQFVFDAVSGDLTHDVHTPDAVADPYEKAISFTEGLFDFPPLRGIITDTHFRARDRYGRLAAFMAVLVAGHRTAAGQISAVGVAERSAVVVDRSGVGTLLTQGRGGRALFLRTGPAKQAVRGKPLISSAIDTVLLDTPGQRFDLRLWCGDGKRYDVMVDGRRRPIYSPGNPYVAPAHSRPASCAIAVRQM
jgi:cyanophycinase